MPIKLLHHKSYHVYNSANIERVRRDEAAAREKEEQEDEILRQRDREQRIEILRRRQRGETTEIIDGSPANRREDRMQEATDADKAIQTAIAATAASGRKRPRDLDDELAAASNALKGAEKRTSSEALFKEGGHINFFEELERAESEGRAGANRSRQQKELQPQNLRNMRLDKPAEEISPWYTTMDMKSTKQRSQSEKERERLSQSSAKKKEALDPLVSMQTYLSRKAEVDQKRREKSLIEPWRRIERGSGAYYAGQSKRVRQNSEMDDLERRAERSGSRISHREHRDGERNSREARSGLGRDSQGKEVMKSKSNAPSNEMQRLIREQEGREEREQLAAREMLRVESRVRTVL
ncbi:uncharacterized protein V1513DRAFT_440878 [Lipomyces chichibuensis]|uniref:uncharacterized protein n=1 Tax=Lipomyces chichibuensis TaxID=1546026 RepID=UPI003343D2D3